MLDSQGRSLASREDLEREGVDYFSELFRERPTSNGKHWFPQLVLEEMNAWFCRTPLEDEVGKVVMNLVVDKPPDPDGFTGVFLQALLEGN